LSTELFARPSLSLITPMKTLPGIFACAAALLVPRVTSGAAEPTLPNPTPTDDALLT
jgi:hypothetical protein